jgi:hypothetical protein
MSRYMTLKELADLLRMKPQTIRWWRMREHPLFSKGIQVTPGGPVLFDRADVDAYLNGLKQPA